MSRASHPTSGVSTLAPPPKSPVRTKAMAKEPNLEPFPELSLSQDVAEDEFVSSAAKGDRIMRGMDRGTPGEGHGYAVQKTPEQRHINKQRSLRFDEVFSGRDPNTARDSVTRESMVMAELKTNVIIRDEYNIIANISLALSTRYQKPEPCICVAVAHTGCLLFAGSFAPAYILHINALASHLQPVTNKRISTLLAKELQEIIGVPPDRGCIIFRPIEEHCFAKGGRTMAGEIEELEKQLAEEGSRTALNRRRSNEKGLKTAGKARKKQSMLTLRGTKAAVSEKPNETAMLESPSDHSIPEGEIQHGRDMSVDGVDKTEGQDEETPLERKFERSSKKISKRKSFMHAVFRVS